MDNKFFIIGGTEKAGTTSIFEYFANHPQICSSKSKETDYFRQDKPSLPGYVDLFTSPPNNQDYYYMEGSPAYLGLAESVIPKVRQVTSCPKLVFVLRDPIERLRSSYLFHRSKLYIPEHIDINAYITMCLAYDANQIQLKDTPFVKSWFLDVLTAGAYKRHIKQYLTEFKDDVLLIDFSQLASQPQDVTNRICQHLDIDSSYFDNFTYYRANKTFQSKFHFIHKLGMKVNNKLEPYFRRNPRVKQVIVKSYKTFNSVKKIEGGELSLSSINALKEFYSQDADFVREYFSQKGQTISWKNFNE